MLQKERSSKTAETILQATQSILSTLSTSYGPRGFDKMIVKDKNTVITNDGATILKYFNTHPIHKILGSVSSAQDTNSGDGTTSVIILIGSLIEYLMPLREKGIHPNVISNALEIAKFSLNYIEKTKIKIDESDYVKVALTALNSKIAAKSIKMAEVAVSALKYERMSEIKIIKQVGGDIDDIKLYKSILIKKKFNLISKKSAKLLILQFCISAPKTNLDSKIEITEFSQMEKFVKEEKEYILNIVRKIKNTGADLLIIQKSILRESCSEMAHHFFKKLGINIIDNVDRNEISYICSKLNVRPIADVNLLANPIDVEIDQNNHFSEIDQNNNNFLEIKNFGCTIVVTGCDDMVVDEAERSLNDVLCVVKSLIEEPFIVPGGCAIEAGIANSLDLFPSQHSIIIKNIAKAFAAMPHFLAKNAGLYSVDVVSTLRKNLSKNQNLGISMRNGLISDMVNDESVIQPSSVSKSMILLAFETVQMLIKIDDILPGNK